MKKLGLFILAFLMMGGVAWAEIYTVIVRPTTTTYETITTRTDIGGETSYQIKKEIINEGAVNYSGTSPCQVIDLSRLKNIGGYFTFQFKQLTGATETPIGSGTTINVHWRGTDIDKPSAWAQATQNTILSNVDAFSGITNIGYDINDITGVTPFKYFRVEFESGASTVQSGFSGVTPIGLLFIR